MSLWLAKMQQSNEVLALQNALNVALEPAIPLPVNGDFDQSTEDAVRVFQKGKHLKVDGIAGPHTLSHLFKLVEVTSTIHAEATGGDFVGGSYDLPDSPLQPPHPIHSSVSLGLADVYFRESIMRRWINRRPPKPPLRLPSVKLHVPPWEYRLHRPDFKPFGPLMRPTVPPSLYLTKILHLKPLDYSSASAKALAGNGVEFEVGLESEGTVSKDVKGFDVQVGRQALMAIGAEWLKGGVRVFNYPQWRFQLLVEAKQINHIAPHHWKQWTLEVSPLIRGSFTGPNFLGADTKGGLKLGLDVKFDGPVGRKKRVCLSVGGGAGAVVGIEMDQDRIDGFAVVPEASFTFNLGVRLCPRRE
jgi:peptidoglycan hydrolase-like protein with peptidoglycan-binding domain